jgi:hypothetical protein
MKFLFLSAALFFLSLKEMSAKKQYPKIHFELIQTGYAVAPLNWVGLPADTVFCFFIDKHIQEKHQVRTLYLWMDRPL